MSTSTNLQTFTFASGEVAHAIRGLMRNGDPWFVARDLLNALDVDRTSLERLDDDEKGVDSIHTPGGQQSITLLSETGMYSLVLSSRKPEAKPFKRWITHEVLPSIARHGAYIDSANRMGETLGAATDGALHVEREDSDLARALNYVASVLITVTSRMDKSEEDLRAMRSEQNQTLRSLRQEMARTVGRVVRVAKAQRPSNKNADPNRPLSDDDVERFKYLLGTGATAKQIARSLNRTYAVIQRFIDTNQDLVIRTLQHSLL